MNALETCPQCKRCEGVPDSIMLGVVFTCMTCRFRWQWIDGPDDQPRRYADRTYATVRASGSAHDGVRLIDMGD